MSTPDLPFRATVAEACAWLAAQTGTPWTLAHLLEHELTPYVWLDYDPAYPELFGDANGGYAAPIFYAADIARLAGGSEDVLITRTKDAYKIIAVLPEPGFTRALADLRFLKKDVEKLAGRLKHAASAPVEVSDGTTAWTRESTLQDQRSSGPISSPSILRANAGMSGLPLLASTALTQACTATRPCRASRPSNTASAAP